MPIFAGYVEVDTCASACGGLTDEDIITQVAGAQPVAEDTEGEDDAVPARLSAPEAMEAINVSSSAWKRVKKIPCAVSARWNRKLQLWHSVKRSRRLLPIFFGQ